MFPDPSHQQRAGSDQSFRPWRDANGVAAFETAIDGMRQDSVPREVQGDALERLFGFAVALEQIGCNLGFAHAPLSGSPLCRADGAFMAS